MHQWQQWYNFSVTYFVVHIPCTNRLTTFVKESTSQPFLEDPGATSQDVAIFSGESLLLELKSPWELIVTEPVSEVVEHPCTDWPENIFSAQSARRSSRVTMSPSYIEQFSSSINLSCLVRITGRHF